MKSKRIADTQSQWVVVQLKDQSFGIPSISVVRFIQLPAITKVPFAPDFIRGQINDSGFILPVIDLRKRLGFPTILEDRREFAAVLDARRQDHENWLDKLYAGVSAGRVPDIQRNPHKCAFGIWYDKFETDDFNLKGIMSQFDKPHKEIHDLARQATNLIKEGKVEEAKDLITKARQTTFVKMLNLFMSAAIQIYHVHEFGVVVKASNGNSVLAVDKVIGLKDVDGVVDEAQRKNVKVGPFFADISSGDEPMASLDVEKLVI